MKKKVEAKSKESPKPAKPAEKPAPKKGGAKK